MPKYYDAFFFLSPSPSKIFPKILASFKRKAYLCRSKAALGKKVESLKKEMDMDKKKNENYR